MHQGLALVSLLIAIGTIPVLPALLGLFKEHANSKIRVAVRAAAALCLFVCFVESFGGVLVAAIPWALPFGEVAVVGCVAAFLITGGITCWLATKRGNSPAQDQVRE